MNISCTPVPEFRFPNSEFRMAYGRSGIPHHKLGDRGGDPETDFGMIDGGWDMGCRTSEFYVNRGVGHWMSWGGVNLATCDNWKGGQGREEWPTRKGQTGKRAKEKPQGDSLGLVVGGWVSYPLGR